MARGQAGRYAAFGSRNFEGVGAESELGRCGTRVNLVSPTAPQPPAFSYDTRILAADGVTHLIEYIETDDFWGRNSYSGVDADGAFSANLWLTGPIAVGTDASGFQTWTEACLPRQ